MQIGDVLKCIDVEGFLSTAQDDIHFDVLKCILDNEMKVHLIEGGKYHINYLGCYLLEEDLKYFRKALNKV